MARRNFRHGGWDKKPYGITWRLYCRISGPPCYRIRYCRRRKQGYGPICSKATHKGNLMGIAPTGNKVRWDAADVYHLKDGKIVEEWAADDMAAILHHVGPSKIPLLK